MDDPQVTWARELVARLDVGAGVQLPGHVAARLGAVLMPSPIAWVSGALSADTTGTVSGVVHVFTDELLAVAHLEGIARRDQWDESDYIGRVDLAVYGRDRLREIVLPAGDEQANAVWRDGFDNWPFRQHLTLRYDGLDDISVDPSRDRAAFTQFIAGLRLDLRRR